ncbi:MAG: hypothetical protein L0241_11625 [Planctomycetia bacterium]|nr:hypothetical protein [Planctomycetia bacterium]
MGVIHATQFEVDPPAGQTTRQCLAAIRDKITGWIRSCYGRKGETIPRFAFDGTGVAPAFEHEIRTDQQDSQIYQLVSVEWEFPERSPPKGGWHHGGPRVEQTRDNTHRRLPVWQFSSLLACDEKVVQVALVVRAVAEGSVLSAITSRMRLSNPLSAVRVYLLDDLVNQWLCRIGQQSLLPFPLAVGESLIPEEVFRNHPEARELFVQAKAAGGDEVAALVEHLLSPERPLPTLVIVAPRALLEGVPGAFEYTQPGYVPTDPANVPRITFPEYIQVRLLGLAQVVVMDLPTAQRLTEHIGPERSLSAPGLRLYWPGFTRTAPPAHHPRYNLKDIRTNLSKSRGPIDSTEASLQHELAYLSGDCFREGPIIRAARTALASLRVAQNQAATRLAERVAAAEAAAKHAQRMRDTFRHEQDTLQRQLDDANRQLADLRCQLAALSSASAPDHAQDELTAELERAWNENAHLRAEAEATRRRLNEIEVELRAAQANLAELWQPLAKPDGVLALVSEPTFANVRDTLTAAAAEFADILVIWDDALRAAEQSRFAHPTQVFRALRAIAEVGRVYFAAQEEGPQLGPVEHAFASRIPFKYSGFESQTTMSMYGAERVFRHAGRSQQMQRHLTLGGGDAVNCLVIYFEFDETAQRVQIGYCGRHLRYAGQRT